MIRYAILLLNMLGLFIYQLFVTDGITVKQLVPADMKPGNEYTIELTITKGSIGGFAKLQQELPEGFTATAIESKGASFSFSGTAVKFIWTSLPGENDFKINYKVKVAANAPTGEKVIAGKFFYVTDNVKQSVEIPESTVNIGEGTIAASATTTDSPTQPEKVAETSETTETVEPEKVQTTQNNTETKSDVPEKIETITTMHTPTENDTDADKNTTSETATPSANLAPANTGADMTCTRKITAGPGSDYTVEILIARGDITGFGKIQENLPAGFSASSIQNSGASFSFADQKVKLVWVNFPTDAEFKVVYKLTGSPAADAKIDGLLSYIENDETKKLVIAATTIPAGVVTTNSSDQQNTTTTTTTPDETNKNATDNNLTTTTVPQAQTSVNYKVQICALRQTAVDAAYFVTRFGFGKVATEMHEGWTKYTVGGFNEYKMARDNREEVRTKGVVGPFVTAYNSGRRITVQEALMISSQKWYK